MSSSISVTDFIRRSQLDLILRIEQPLKESGRKIDKHRIVAQSAASPGGRSETQPSCASEPRPSLMFKNCSTIACEVVTR